MFRKIMILSLLVICMAGLICCNVNTPDRKAKALLSKYNLHVQEDPEISTWKLEDERFTEDYVMPSKAIGYDIIPYKGKKVKRYAYILQERCQTNNFNGQIVAYVFLNDRNDIIGGCMVLQGYMGGTYALNCDRGSFAPKDLKPDKPKFNGIKEISIRVGKTAKMKPLTELYSVHVTDSKQIKELLALLEKSEPVKEPYSYKKYPFENEIIYSMGLHYTDGPYIGIDVHYPVDASKKAIVEIINMDNRYILDKNLLTYIDKLRNK